MQMSSQDLHTEVPMSIPEELPDKHQCGGSPQDLRTRTRTSTTHVRTTRGCHQDLFESFSQGPAQDHAKAHGKISLKSVRRELREMKDNNWTRASCQDHPGPLRDFHKIVTKGPAGSDTTEIQEPRQRRTSKKDFLMQGPLLDKFKEQDFHKSQNLDAAPCRAPRSRLLCEPIYAVDMHMDMSQEPFDARIFRQSATNQGQGQP